MNNLENRINEEETDKIRPSSGAYRLLKILRFDRIIDTIISNIGNSANGYYKSTLDGNGTGYLPNDNSNKTKRSGK